MAIRRACRCVLSGARTNDRARLRETMVAIIAGQKASDPIRERIYPDYRGATGRIVVLKFPARHLAARFAAEEAVSKTGWFKSVILVRIHVIRV